PLVAIADAGVGLLGLGAPELRVDLVVDGAVAGLAAVVCRLAATGAGRRGERGERRAHRLEGNGTCRIHVPIGGRDHLVVDDGERQGGADRGLAAGGLARGGGGRGRLLDGGNVAAVERLARMLTAAEAPIPTLPPVVGLLGVAVADDSVTSAASMLTACVSAPANVTAPPVPIVATLSLSTRLVASDPAIPTLVAPAPEVAVVVKLFLPSGPIIVAPMSSEPAVMALLTVASFLTCARLIPTATPTPVEESTAEPSALISAPLAVADCTETLPVEVTVPVEAMLAVEFEVRSAMARPPTTDTLPSVVSVPAEYLLSPRKLSASLPLSGCSAPPAAAAAVAVTAVEVELLSPMLPASTLPAPSISAEVSASMTLTATLAPNAACCGVASSSLVMSLLADIVRALVMWSCAEPPTSTLAVLSTVETATAPSAVASAGTSDCVAMRVSTVDVALS